MTTLTLVHTPRCAWCHAAYLPNRVGRPRLYCGPICRQNAARYLERLPAWRAELAEAEAAAAEWQRIRRPVPNVVRNQIANLEWLIGQRP